MKNLNEYLKKLRFFIFLPFSLAVIQTHSLIAFSQILYQTNDDSVQFEDSFEKGWIIFEEIINPYYGKDIGEVAYCRDVSFTGSQSLRIWANKYNSKKSNHVIGACQIYNHGVKGYYVYSLYSYIPIDNDIGQTGPEFSVQNTMNGITYTAGIQFVANTWVAGGKQWNIWHDGRWAPFLTKPLTKENWYYFELEFLYSDTANKYMSLSIKDMSVGIDTVIDLSQYEIKGENKAFDDALWITLEAENLWTNGTEYKRYKIYYDDIKLIKKDPISSIILNTKDIPVVYNLNQNYPNPFNPTTFIEYSIPKPAFVTLIIYNALGQKIRTLVQHRHLPGNYKIQWNGRNDNGQEVVSGAFFYQLRFDGKLEAKKMIFIR